MKTSLLISTLGVRLGLSYSLELTVCNGGEWHIDSETCSNGSGL